jgi:aryl-alcohol dehydrogenase-like predicted oxidoreductase
MNRRKFIKTSMGGLVGLSVLHPETVEAERYVPSMIDSVSLGNTGIMASRIALGTGTIGLNKSASQQSQNADNYPALIRHCFDRGVRFFDMADSYGSHSLLSNALKKTKIQRDSVVLMTKMWTYPDGTPLAKNADANIKKYLQELDTDYIDILLMHCIVDSNWNENRKYYMDTFSKAKQAGLIKSVGVSCHNLDALRKAASDPWVDVILARVNPFQTLMDGSPDEVNTILGTAKNNGKGVMGMKIFGEGKHITDKERQFSLEYAMKTANIHGIALGMQSKQQVDDAVARIKMILK